LGINNSQIVRASANASESAMPSSTTAPTRPIWGFGRHLKTSTGQRINNSGMVVGDSNGVMNGGMFGLNSLIAPNSGFTIVYASGINDKGPDRRPRQDMNFKGRFQQRRL
jgi:hypothetical protein